MACDACAVDEATNEGGTFVQRDEPIPSIRPERMPMDVRVASGIREDEFGGASGAAQCPRAHRRYRRLNSSTAQARGGASKDVASELSRAEGALGHHAAGAKYTAYAIAHAPPREGSEFKNTHASRLAFSLPHIYSAKLKVAPADLSVMVDGVELDVPVEIGLYLEPGPHRVEFKKSGYVTETREIDAKAGVQDSLVVELKKEATADGDAIPATNVQPKPASSAVQPLPPESPVAPPRSSGNAALAWTVLGVGSGLTAIAVGTGVYFHVKGADSQDKADQYEGTLGAVRCSGDLQSPTCLKLKSALEDRIDHYQRAKVLYGVGAGLAVITGIATWYFWPKALEDKTPSVSAWAAPDSAGLVTYGRF